MNDPLAPNVCNAFPGVTISAAKSAVILGSVTTEVLTPEGLLDNEVEATIESSEEAEVVDSLEFSSTETWLDEKEEPLD
jgi:hypothetical protein